MEFVETITKRPHSPKVTSKSLSDRVFMCLKCGHIGGTLTKGKNDRSNGYVCFGPCKPSVEGRKRLEAAGR